MLIKENKPVQNHLEDGLHKKAEDKTALQTNANAKTAEQKKMEVKSQEFQQNSAAYLKSKLDSNNESIAGKSSATKPKKPMIDSWEYRNTKGAESSADNYCATCPIVLGVNSPDDRYFTNGIEMKANIKNHSYGYVYDIKRKLDSVFWEKIPDGDSGFTWEETGKQKNVKDDKTDNDEYLVPQTKDAKEGEEDVIDSDKIYYIYSKDRPAVGRRNPALNKNATEVIFSTNFTESVNIINTGKRFFAVHSDPKTFQWHCVIYLKKNEKGWYMDEANSSISEGHVSLSQPTE